MYSVEKTKGPNLTKQFDYMLFITVLLLTGIGLAVLYSASQTAPNGSRMMMIQTISVFLGMALAFIICAIDYKDFKTLGIFLYIFSLLLLVVVLFIGIGGEDLGSRSWIKIAGITFQPAEVAKITFIMMVALFLERIKEGGRDKKNFLKLVVYAALPLGLILAQRDFGTALVFIFILFVMVFIAGIPYKYIFILFGAFAASLPFLWFFVLNDKRKERIRVFLDPTRDALGAGWNVTRSKIAIGSGQLFGKGLLQGVQTQNSGVPVKESDFIFSVVGEELGFVGAVLILVLVSLILMRCIYIAKNSRDFYGSYLVIGMLAMLGFHFIENIGMSVGALPVTGVPLPFVSNGGSAMITNYIAIGIILSVSMRRKKTIFNNS